MACAALNIVHAQIKVLPREKLEAVANPRLSPDSASLQFDVRKIIAEPMNEVGRVIFLVFGIVCVSDRCSKGISLYDDQCER